MSGFRADVHTSFDEARAIAAGWAALPAAGVPLAEALGCVLASALVSRSDVPAFPTSAMDGWAVAGAGPWSLTGGRVLAGAAPAALAEGTAVEIATGAMLPQGSSGVLRRELGVVDGERLSGELSSSRDFLPVGGECVAGDELLPAGTLVTPPVVGLAATVGHDELLVRPRPRVAVAVLGDELLDTGFPANGRVRDSLSPQLGGWIEALGGSLVSAVRVPDELSATARAFEVDADLVLSTGGTAAGPVDHVHAALGSTCATVLVDGVAVRPGHPMVLARLADGRPFIGLPGNPLSACVTLLTLVAPVLDALRGLPPVDLPTVVLAEPVSGRDPDERLLPVVLGPDGAVSVPHIGSAMLRGLSLAHGVAVIPPGGAARGDLLRWMRLPW
ncbi:MAG: moaA2 [Frankiales bacterium]|nr:moaA2 [Frankiales bacterium]